MKQITMILLLIVGLMFSGCAYLGAQKTTRSTDAKGNPIEVTEPASLLGPNADEVYTEGYKSFSVNKTMQIVAVAKSPSIAKTDEGRGFEAGMKYMTISEIARQPFQLQKGKTVMDVLDHGVGIIPGVIEKRGLENIMKAALREAGDIHLENSPVTDGFKWTDQQMLQIGDTPTGTIQGVQEPQKAPEPAWPPEYLIPQPEGASEPAK
jgi:hypothetical protein